MPNDFRGPEVRRVAAPNRLGHFVQLSRHSSECVLYSGASQSPPSADVPIPRACASRYWLALEYTTSLVEPPTSACGCPTVWALWHAVIGPVLDEASHGTGRGFTGERRRKTVPTSVSSVPWVSIVVGEAVASREKCCRAFPSPYIRGG